MLFAQSVLSWSWDRCPVPGLMASPCHLGCLIFPEAPSTCLLAAPYLVPFPLSKASSGKVTGFPYWSPQALPAESCSLSPAPPTASSGGTPWQGSALAGPSPCLHGNQEGCGCGLCTHMNAEGTPVSRGERAPSIYVRTFPSKGQWAAGAPSFWASVYLIKGCW